MYIEILEWEIELPTTELVLCEGGYVKSVKLVERLRSFHGIDATFLPGGINFIHYSAKRNRSTDVLVETLNLFKFITTIMTKDNCKADYPFAWDILSTLSTNIVFTGAAWQAEEAILKRYPKT